MQMKTQIKKKPKTTKQEKRKLTMTFDLWPQPFLVPDLQTASAVLDQLSVFSEVCGLAWDPKHKQLHQRPVRRCLFLLESFTLRKNMIKDNMDLWGQN